MSSERRMGHQPPLNVPVEQLQAEIERLRSLVETLQKERNEYRADANDRMVRNNELVRDNEWLLEQSKQAEATRAEQAKQLRQLNAENAELRRLDAGYASNMALLSWLGRYHAEAEKARVAWAAAGPEFDAEDVLELVFDLNRWVLNNPKPGAGT